MRDISGLSINSDAVIVGVSASGLWLKTAKFPRVKMAWMLVRLAWRTLHTLPR